MTTINAVFNTYTTRRRLTPKTRKLHRFAQQGLAQFLGHQLTLQDLTDDNLSAFIVHRFDQGRASHTIQGETAKLLALWRFCCKLGLLATWPTIEPIRPINRVPQAWTQLELEKLFQAASDSQPVGLVPGGLWWSALLCLLWDTGERIGAVLELDWSTLDLETPCVLFPAETRKGGRADNWLRISPETAALIRQLPRDRPVFHWPYNNGTLYNRYRALLQRAGLPTDRHSKFHRIRRSTASHYKAAGGDPTSLLGHSSAAVTRKYLDPRIVKTPAPSDILFTLAPPAQSPGQSGPDPPALHTP